MKKNIEISDWEMNVILSYLVVRAKSFMENNDIDGAEMCMNVYSSLKSRKND